MLSTEERHKFGQHYTRSEVVDLINAFCIRDASAKVLDPACGGGTFLVRAYTRKRDLSEGQLTHQDLIQQLYGIDISAYPAHLTTVNLATRDLIDQANYPLVVRNDFFKVNVGDALFVIPLGIEGSQVVMEQIGKVDVIVGNPPYVRQEKINEYYGSGYKKYLNDLLQREWPATALSGRSDIHCYFFPHALAFLKEGGSIGLLTSSTWLDTGYGFRLQKFLLDHFEIVAVFESNCEPWFTGARVTTAAVILRHQPDPDKRAGTLVKFVWLTRPLAGLLTYAGTEEDRRLTFDALKKRIETMTGKEEFALNISGHEPVRVRQESLDGLRVRMIRQSDLDRLGCLPFTVSEEEEGGEDEEEAEDPISSHNGEWHEEMASGVSLPDSEYVGYKWGIFLRAPDIFFKLLQRGGSRFVPLEQKENGIAWIKRGITSGCDAFFLPRDITDEALTIEEDETFRQRYGIERKVTGRVRIVKAGDGSVHLIESQYLEPVVFNLMEVDSAEIDPRKLKKQILLVSEPKAQLQDTHVLRYIEWGEREGFHERSTCANRTLWYELSVPQRGDALWTMTQRYR